MNIPIWPGSSSFSTGKTPFGFYDNDLSFSTDADKVAKFCSQRLGYPIMLNYKTYISIQHLKKLLLYKEMNYTLIKLDKII